MPKFTVPPKKEGAGGGGKYLLTPGVHKMTFTAYEFGTTQNGDEKVSLKFEKGEIFVYKTITFKEQCFWVAVAFLAAMGHEQQEGATVNMDAAMLDSLIGQDCELDIGHEDKPNGYKGNKIKSFKPQAIPY